MSDRPIAKSEEPCACCGDLKPCGLYVLQSGETAWVCRECRRGKK